uniref:Uncharacterized protein n=1 Tax=Romanomermis culicivorax TaxID=13658 RepID=A0A915IVH2_ROMCU
MSPVANKKNGEPINGLFNFGLKKEGNQGPKSMTIGNKRMHGVPYDHDMANYMIDKNHLSTHCVQFLDGSYDAPPNYIGSSSFSGGGSAIGGFLLVDAGRKTKNSSSFIFICRPRRETG